VADNEAEAHYSRAGELRARGRFEEALAAFDEAIARRPTYAEAHNGRGIVLSNLARPNDAIDGFDRAIALKPDYAEAYNNRGIVLQDLNRPEDALASFDRAIELSPDNARVYNNRGVTLQELRRFEEALAGFDQAIALKPDYAEAYYNRGMVFQDLKRFDDALASFGTAIALRPNYAEAYNNRGVVLQDIKRPNEAVADYDKVIALIPDFAEAYANKSYCLLQMGQFAPGWRLHEWRKKLEHPVGDRSFPQPLWLGQEDISNKTLFVHWEQGFGDTIQFCRYGTLLKSLGACVVMSVQGPLCGLLEQMGPGMRIVDQDEVPGTFDFHCPLMSLPLALGTTLETIPSQRQYIFADEERREVWARRLSPGTKPRIGIVWSGSTKHKNDLNRSIDPRALGLLLAADVHWISLQKDFSHADRYFLAKAPHILACGDELKDFSDAAAVIDLLDLVITVDTAIAHLAAAMGKPVWILLPFNSDWRWLLDRDDSPWYPTARLFRQVDYRSWDDVIGRVRVALDGFLRSGP